MSDTDLNIKVDMGRVESSVKAAIRPAVEQALEYYDIKGAILRQLTQERPKKGKERDLWAMPYLMMRSGYGGETDLPTLLDELVRTSIHEIAKEYVRTNIQMQREEIEEAFRKMMNGSTSRLVKAFAGSVEDALKSDWGFDLDVKVSHKVAEKERSYGDD